MEKILIVLGALVLSFLAAILGGVFLWLLWPIAIPAAFPALVASGVLASSLSLWESICLTWIFALLFKTTISSEGSKK